MRVDCLSDLHGNLPYLYGGDLLLIAGDISTHGTEEELQRFYSWIVKQPYLMKVFIAGNHDTHLVNNEPPQLCETVKYLRDSGCTFEFDEHEYHIWGSPWQLRFAEQNQDFTAFSLFTEADFEFYLDKAPWETEILLTHCPPDGVLDKTIRKNRTGSRALARKSMIWMDNLQLHVFGHIHESRGVQVVPINNEESVICVNASNLAPDYTFINSPIRVVL